MCFSKGELRCPKAPHPALVPGGAATTTADKDRGRPSGGSAGRQLCRQEESDLGENLRKQRKQAPWCGGNRQESYGTRGRPASPSCTSPRNSSGSGRSRFCSTAVPIVDKRGSQSRQRAESVRNLLPSPDRVVDTGCSLSCG